MREIKNSGIEWIGDIPSDWICNKTFRIFDIIGSGTTPKADNDNNFIGSIPWIQSGDINGGILQNTKNMVSEEVVQKYSALKIYNAPFIVLAMYGASIGNISWSVIDGCVNQACCVLSNGHIQTKYAFYTLKSAQDYLIYKGVGGGQPNISQDTIKQLWLPTPSIEEQHKIADYLDCKCAEIDAVIEKTKATVEEYKKLKQSVITEAVTKGIRGDRPMKDSGIEWIGEIPAEWETTRLKNIATSFTKGYGITKEDAVEDGDTPCVRYGEIYSKYNQAFTECVTRTNLSLISAPKYFTYGDILFTCTGELVEEIGKSIVYLGDGECLAGGDIIILKHSQHPAFLNYALNSHYAQAQKSCDKTKLKVVHISASDIGNILLALPPIAEQKEIADYLDKKCAEIDALIAKKTALLEEMESYKKSVIYEYVTGKKEVM